MTDLLKQFIQDRRDIADKATPGPWEATSDLPNYAILNMADSGAGAVIKRIVVASENHRNRWHGDTLGTNKENAAFICDARKCIPLQLQIIELQERAIGYALRGISNCGCAPEDEDRCRGCVARQAVNEIRDAVEALLLSSKEQERTCR